MPNVMCFEIFVAQVEEFLPKLVAKLFGRVKKSKQKPFSSPKISTSKQI
jgi:hypothetical protein